MNMTAAQIGFDRFVPLELAEAALRVGAGLASLDELKRRWTQRIPAPRPRRRMQRC